MRTPSFGNVQALPNLLEGKLLADSIASLGSVDFVLGDSDRAVSAVLRRSLRVRHHRPICVANSLPWPSIYLAA